MQHPDAEGERVFRDWLCEYAYHAGMYIDVARQVRDAFRIETAEGVQLDMIGAVVGLPRSGYSDTRYRALLQIQAIILSGDVGTVDAVLRVVRLFIGASVLSPIVLLQAPPYSFSLTVPGGLSLIDTLVLASFVRRSIYAAVLGQMIVSLDDLVYCYLVAGDTADAGTYCYLAEADTTGSAVYAHIVEI